MVCAALALNFNHVKYGGNMLRFFMTTCGNCSDFMALIKVYAENDTYCFMAWAELALNFNHFTYGVFYCFVFYCFLFYCF